MAQDENEFNLSPRMPRHIRHFRYVPQENSKSLRMAAGQTIGKMNWKRQTAGTWSQQRKKVFSFYWKCCVASVAKREYSCPREFANTEVSSNRFIETSNNWLARRSCYQPTIRSIRTKTNENRNEKSRGKFPLIDGRFIKAPLVKPCVLMVWKDNFWLEFHRVK